MEAQEIDEAYLVKIRRIAFRFARKRGNKQGQNIDPDDFAQFCVIFVLENNKKIGNWLWRYTDFIRKYIGHVTNDESKRKNPVQTLRQAENLLYFELNDEIDMASEIDLEFLADRIYFKKIFRNIKPHKQMAFILFHKYEYSVTEIGEMRGITVASMCNELKSTLVAIQNNLKMARKPLDASLSE